ncbi:putative RNA-directed DNA polymerase [Tanacetum coccineum]|uniref:RNA-directed DNA polymerase n=1 Tax=Tanacetum coccineum TaxID=301880 RepID=A0ABQ5DXI1_9ASTR
MTELFNSLGIIYQTSCAYTPQQNGIVERKHRYLLNVARSLLFQSGIPLNMWTECVLTAAYLINRLSSSIPNGKSPFELVYGFKPKISHLRSFGCLCFSYVLNNSDKFSAKSEKCILIGFSTTKKAYKHSNFQSSLSPNDDGRVYDTPYNDGSDHSCFSNADECKDDFATSMGETSTSEGNVHINSESPAQGNFPQNISQVQPDLRRSSRVPKMPAKFNDYVVNSSKNEPTSYFEAVKNPNWIEAMNNEIEALNKNNTWTVCDLPVGRKAVGSKWLWKITYKSTGEIERYKARVVAKGFSQREEFDYLETFSPVVKMSTVRYVYMTLPFGFDTDKSKFDYSLFTKNSDNVFIILLVYVDDIVVTGNNLNEIEKFKQFLNQRKYCLELLHEFGLLAAKHVDTPLPENATLNHSESDDDHLLVNVSNYQRLVGKLIYLTNTRPDIAYVVHCLSQYIHSPLNSHLDAALRVLRYLKGSPWSGIQINKISNLKRRAYADSNWARSSAKAEYISMASATCLIAANPAFHEKSKHFEIDVHFVREKIACGVIKTEKIHTTQQIADILTKGLDIEQHKILCGKLEMLDMFKLEKT